MDDRERELLAYVEACDAIRGRMPDDSRAARMATLLRPLVEFGERLGPWPGVKPAGADSDPRL